MDALINQVLRGVMGLIMGAAMLSGCLAIAKRLMA